MAHELKAKHIQAETLENKADDRLLLRSILSYIEDHSDSFEDEDVVSKRFVEERLASIGEEKYIGSIASIENIDDDIPEPEEDMLIVTRDTLSVYWYDGDEWQQIGGAPSETPESIKTKYESNENTNAFTDANQSKLAGIATGATKNANTDELSEGIENKYFTEARAVASKLAGYVKAATVSAISSATSILEAIGILEKALDNKVDKVAGSGLITDAEKLIFADKYTKNETDNLISGAISSLIWKDDVAEFADLATEYPDAIEGWTSVVNDENKIYRFDGTDWVPIGDITIPMATETVDGKMSKENFIKLRDIEDEATKNTNTDELDEGTTNKYFTDARAVAAKLAGYVKAETPIPLAEADSILQALGKLEGLLDGKLSIEGDNFIAVRPTANAIQSGNAFIASLNRLKSFTPGGQPLGPDNRVTLMVFPGVSRVESDQLVLAEYVDIVGIGPRESIVIECIENYGLMLLQPDPVNDVRLENITLRGRNDAWMWVSSDNTNKTVWRNIVVDGLLIQASTTDTSETVFEGVYENIAAINTNQLFLTSQEVSGRFINISGLIATPDFGITRGYYENCDIGNCEVLEDSVLNNCNIRLGYYELVDWIELNGCTLNNCNILIDVLNPPEIGVATGTTFGYCTFEDVNNQAIFMPLSGTTAEINFHHCFLKSGIIGEGIINLIPHGHNTWDEEGTGDGIEDIVAGTNISIDKTDPKNPIINSTADGGDGYETPEEVRDALSELTGENRLDASSIKNLPSTGLTPEQEAQLENVPLDTISELDNKVDKEEGKGLSSNDYTLIEKNKLENIEEEAQKNVQSDWNQENSNSDDFIKNKPSLFSGSYDDLEDVPSSFPSTIEDVDGLEAELIDLQDQITTNENKLEYVLNFPSDVLTYDFKETIDIKINSIKIEPESGQTVDLGGYILGEALEAYTVLSISVNQGGIIELIGERV